MQIIIATAHIVAIFGVISDSMTSSIPCILISARAPRHSSCCIV